MQQLPAGCSRKCKWWIRWPIKTTQINYSRWLLLRIWRILYILPLGQKDLIVVPVGMDDLWLCWTLCDRWLPPITNQAIKNAWSQGEVGLNYQKIILIVVGAQINEVEYIRSVVKS